jgi:hypothetical protein
MEDIEKFTGPTTFTVAVMMQRRSPPPGKPWLCDSWRVTGVVVQQQRTAPVRGKLVHSGTGEDDFLWSGFPVHLYQDETESYYLNLLSKNPSLYVICYRNGQGIPEPFLVSASFDVAHAYLEGEAEVEAVPMPPEFYPWIERYVISHYFPEPNIKRKRRNWTETDRESF